MIFRCEPSHQRITAATRSAPLPQRPSLPLPDFTYHPDHVIYPMKRAKEDRGKNKWERTTWEDAYNIIEENIGRIKKEHGAESIVVFGETSREGGPMCGPYGMAMINIIIQEDLYDHDFVDRFCYGFEQLAERVATMPAEKATEICGLDVEFRERHRSMVGTHYGASPNMLGSVVDAVKVGETKGDLEIQYELGTRLNPGTYARFANFEEFRAEFRMGNCGMTYEELKEKVVYQREVNYRKYETGRLRPDGQPGFNTPTGRIELYSTMFRQFGEDPLPYYEEPQQSPVSTPELMDEYPFVLTTGARTYAYFHSEGKQIPLLRELNPDPLLEIHPKDAAKLGIADGEWVNVENQFGKCELKAKVVPVVKPGVVHAQHGFWFPEEDGEEPHLFGVWRSNINELVPHKNVGKLGFGAPFKCLICKVEKIAK